MTRSRNSPGLSPSKATTNSWSSRPNEYVVLRRMVGYFRPTFTCSSIIVCRSAYGRLYEARVLRRLVGELVDRAPRHRDVAVGRREIRAQVRAVQGGLEIDQRLEVLGDLPQEDVAIAADADQAVRPQQQPAMEALDG